MTNELNNNGWEKQVEWWGNPSLGYESYKKEFKTRHRTIPVFIFGKVGQGLNTPCYDYHEKDEKGNYVTESRYIKEYHDFSDWSFCVHAGASSDYSYTGGFPNTPTIEEAMAYVDQLHKDGKLLR